MIHGMLQCDLQVFFVTDSGRVFSEQETLDHCKVDGLIDEKVWRREQPH